MSAQRYEDELRSERSYVAGLYTRLDAERVRLQANYSAALRGPLDVKKPASSSGRQTCRARCCRPETKGLEFDAVLVVEPERIIAEGPRGAADLYVALTRATQRLGVLHLGPLPQALAGLAEVHV